MLAGISLYICIIYHIKSPNPSNKKALINLIALYMSSVGIIEEHF